MHDKGKTVNFSSKKDDGSQRSHIMVVIGSLLATSPSENLRKMPLSLDNNLPAAVLRFGNNAEDEVAFTCHLDSCAAMNTANLTLHQWIMTTYPAIVDSYEQFDDVTPFQPIGLDCDVPSVDTNAIANQLTAVAAYKTHYRDENGAPVTLSFGVAQGIPKCVSFASTQFIRPQRANATGLALFTQYTAAISTPVSSVAVLSIEHGPTSD